MKAFYEHLLAKAFFPLLILAALLFLELFTPVAPFQRALGLTLASLPYEVKTHLYGQEVADRLLAAEDQLDTFVNQHVIYDRNGEVLVGGGGTHFPQMLRDAVVAIENHRLYDSFVVDYLRFTRAALAHLTGFGRRSGASGIVQQAARGLILDDRSYTLARKIKEAAIALDLRTRYGADDLLTWYLASVFLGSNTYGFHKASEAYLGKPIQDLTRLEDILWLAVMLDAPNRYLRDEEAHRKRFRLIVHSLYMRDLLPLHEARRLMEVSHKGLSFKRQEQHLRGVATRHAVQLVRDRYPNRDTLATYIDTDVSVAGYRMLRAAVNSFTDRTSVSDIDGFVLMAHGDTLIALVGSVSRYLPNQAMMQTAWSPGSTAKLLLFGSYYHHGGRPDSPLGVRPARFILPGNQTWAVHNYTDRYDRSIPTLPAAITLARSLNVPAAYLALGYGDSLLVSLRDVGVDYPPYPAVLLGASAVVPPLEFFRLLQVTSAPYGRVPSTFRLTSDDRVVSQPLFRPRSAHRLALTMGLAVDDTLGTARLFRTLYGHTSHTLRVKTGTAQQHTAASLLVSLPGGVMVFAGVFSRSGRSLVYSRGGGVTGASLIPFVQHLLQDSSLHTRVARAFTDIPSSAYVLLEDEFGLWPFPDIQP